MSLFKKSYFGNDKFLPLIQLNAMYTPEGCRNLVIFRKFYVIFPYAIKSTTVVHIRHSSEQIKLFHKATHKK